MRLLSRFFTLTAVLVATSACTLGNFNFQPEAETVELRNEADVADCTLLGTTTEKTKDRWAPTRSDKKVAIELLTLARNEAIQMDGNTVVETTELVMGRQTFAIYSCP